MKWEKIRVLAEKQSEEFETTESKEGMITFEFDGVDIINPFYDETGRFEVDPEEYYGEAFLESDWISINVTEIKSGNEVQKDPAYRFKKRLDMMIDATIAVSEAWEDVDSDFNEKAIENYPFDKDFREITGDLIKWRESIES